MSSRGPISLSAFLAERPIVQSAAVKNALRALNDQLHTYEQWEFLLLGIYAQLGYSLTPPPGYGAKT